MTLKCVTCGKKIRWYQSNMVDFMSRLLQIQKAKRDTFNQWSKEPSAANDEFIIKTIEQVTGVRFKDAGNTHYRCMP